MTKLNSAIELDFNKFFRWWKRELLSMVPEDIKRLVSDRQGYLLVLPEDNQFDVSYLWDGKAENLGKFERDEAGFSRYKEVISADERFGKAALVFRLTKRFAVQKEIAFPLAAKDNLHQVATYELSRFSPFMAEQAYYAVKIIEVSNETGQIRVLLILTAREVLDTFLRDIQAFGMSPKLVDYEAAPNDISEGEEAYNLLPESLRQKPDRTAQLVHGGLAALAALLLLAALSLPVWFQYRAVNMLQAKIDSIEKEAKNIKAMQAEADALVDETKRLLAKKMERPPVVEVLDTLSKLIKDDTWLAYGQYANGQLQMQGESPAASTLISVLEASEIFSNAKFVSPVTRDNVSKLERFQITVDITKNAGAEADGTE